MAESQHPWDGIAEELFSWTQELETWAVDAIRGGHRTPFSAETSEKDKLEYFRRQMYKTNPDGSIDFEQPNAEGRDKLLKQYGVSTYAQVMQAVKPEQGRRKTPEPIEEAVQTLLTEEPPPPEEMMGQPPMQPMPVGPVQPGPPTVIPPQVPLV